MGRLKAFFRFAPIISGCEGQAELYEACMHSDEISERERGADDPNEGCRGRRVVLVLEM